LLPMKLTLWGEDLCGKAWRRLNQGGDVKKVSSGGAGISAEKGENPSLLGREA